MGGGGRQELQEGRRAGGEERGAGGGEREGAVTMIERESGEGGGVGGVVSNTHLPLSFSPHDFTRGNTLRYSHLTTASPPPSSSSSSSTQRLIKCYKLKKRDFI